MSSPVSERVRQFVAERAEFVCEYCLLHEEDGFFGFQVDHVISRKHHGSSDSSNLAFACSVCNRRKGSDSGTLSRRTGTLTRFFNPRSDAWHFRLDGFLIEPLSDIADGTARILGFNEEERLTERQTLLAMGRYPSIAALARLRL